MCCNIKEWCPHDPVYSILFRPVGSGEEGTRAAPGNAAPPLATNHPPRANSGGQPEILQIGCGGGEGGGGGIGGMGEDAVNSDQDWALS